MPYINLRTGKLVKRSGQPLFSNAYYWLLAGDRRLLLCGATFKFPKFVDSRDFGLRAGVPQGRSRWPTGSRPGQGRLLVL